MVEILLGLFLFVGVLRFVFLADLPLLAYVCAVVVVVILCLSYYKGTSSGALVVERSSSVLG